MIESSYIEFQVYCDWCSYYEEFSRSQYAWGDVIKKIKSSGWRISKEGEEWLHKCPICSE